MKRCPCLTSSRRATFITLNDSVAYVCKDCGRLHSTRHMPKHFNLIFNILITSVLLLLLMALIVK